MIALILLDLHATRVNSTIALLEETLAKMTTPVYPFFISETFGEYETLLVLKYSSHKDLTRFINQHIMPLPGLQRLEKYALVKPTWIATPKQMEENPPFNQIHTLVFIDTTIDQREEVYNALLSQPSDSNHLKKFVTKVFYQDKMSIILSIQFPSLESLDLYLKNTIRKLPGITNTSTLIGTLFTYLAPLDQIPKQWNSQ